MKGVGHGGATALSAIRAACAKPGRLLSGLGSDRDKTFFAAKLRSSIAPARAFVVEDDVIGLATELRVMHPDVLGNLLHRSRSPFPTVWVEFSIDAMLDAAALHSRADKKQLAEARALRSPGLRLGALIRSLEDGRNEAVLFEVGTTGYVTMADIALLWRLDRPVSLDELEGRLRKQALFLRSHIRTSPTDSQRMLMGQAYASWCIQEDEPAIMSDRVETCDRLASHVIPFFNHFDESHAGVVMANVGGRDDLVTEHMDNVLGSLTGLWSTIIAVLALMNSPDLLNDTAPMGARAASEPEKGGAGWRPWEPKFLRLKLERPAARRAVLSEIENAAARRRHEVRGYWRQVGQRSRAECDHVFILESGNRETCVDCGGSRVWVRNHERGNAELGFVRRDVVVGGGR